MRNALWMSRCSPFSHSEQIARLRSSYIIKYRYQDFMAGAWQRGTKYRFPEGRCRGSDSIERLTSFCIIVVP